MSSVSDPLIPSNLEQTYQRLNERRRRLDALRRGILVDDVSESSSSNSEMIGTYNVQKPSTHYYSMFQFFQKFNEISGPPSKVVCGHHIKFQFVIQVPHPLRGILFSRAIKYRWRVIIETTTEELQSISCPMK